MIVVHALQVNNGDCFMIVFPDCDTPKLLVIDSGYAKNFYTLQKMLLELTTTYDCDIHMVLTHIDQDHIGGFKSLFRNFVPQKYGRISRFYYNTLESLQKFSPCVTKEMVQAEDEISVTTKTSYNDAVTLEKFLRAQGISVQTGLQAGGQINFSGEVQAHILTPSPSSLAKYHGWLQRKFERQTAAVDTDYDKPLAELMAKNFISDENPVNASSVSLLIEAFGRRLLFLGDALPEDVVAGVRALGYSENRPLQVDLVKISHHGSRHNTSPELLQLIQGDCFLISGQGGRGHPDKETLARIIRFQNNPVLWFNYDISNDIFTPSEVKDFHIQTKWGTEWRVG